MSNPEQKRPKDFIVKREPEFAKDWGTLESVRSTERKTVTNITQHWQFIQLTEATETKHVPPDETIANHWRDLSGLLTAERVDEHQMQEIARETLPYEAYENERINGIPAYSYWFHRRYGEELARRQDRRQEAIDRLILTASSLRDIPPTTSARVLWNNVFTESAKEIVLGQKKAFHDGVQKIEETQHFTSYKDPAFRELATTNTEPGRIWYDSLLGPRESITRTTALIGSIEDIPLQTKQVLADPNHLRRPTASVIEERKRDIVTSYAVDVATVFILGDIPQLATK